MCQKHISQGGVSNCIPQYSVGCNYLSLPEIPASGTKVLIFDVTKNSYVLTLSAWVPTIKTGALGAWHWMELSQNSRPPFSYPLRAVHNRRYTAREDRKNWKWVSTLQWRHKEHDGVSNQRRLDCLLNRLFRHGSRNTSRLRVTGLCEGNPPVTGGFPSQRAGNAKNVSIWWRHHG